MRRPVLITLVLLGSLISLIGGTGLFAALTDNARTGTNTVDSAALAGSADIQIATATRAPIPGFSGTPFACGTYSEDLASGFFTVSDVAPGYSSEFAYFCIKNVGSQAVTLWASTDELVDTDTACTGDEALHGDTTCGGDLAGELSTVLFAAYTLWDCNGSSGGGFLDDLNHNSTSPGALPGSLAVGQVACLSIDLGYLSNATADEVQRAQSDRATWRFKFRADAVAS